MNTNDDLAPEWDALLDDGLINPPADFHARVMQQLQQDALGPSNQATWRKHLTNALQAAAVLLGALGAAWQTLSFIVGLWATTLAI